MKEVEQGLLSHFKMRKQVCEVKRTWVDSKERVEDPRVGEEWGLEDECDRMGNSEDIFRAGEQGMWGQTQVEHPVNLGGSWSGVAD